MKMKIRILPYPHLVLWKDELPNDFKGTTKGPVVTLLNEITLNDPIYTHEVQHVCQYWNTSLISLVLAAAWSAVLSLWWLLPYTPITFAVYPILYTLGSTFRYNMEIDAYAEQVKCYDQSIWGAKIDLFASFIATKYDLKDPPSQDAIADDILDAIHR